MLTPKYLQLKKREIMRYAGGMGASMKMPAQKLDQFGYIKLYSGLANDQAWLANLEKQLMRITWLTSVVFPDLLAKLDH